VLPDKALSTALLSGMGCTGVLGALPTQHLRRGL